MNKKKVILIGRINKNKLPIGGETAKNQSLLQELEKYCHIYALDFYKYKRRPWIFLWTIIVLMIHADASIILASTASNIYPFIKIFYILKSKRNIIHWIIGGEFWKLIQDGKFGVKYFNHVNCNIAESPYIVSRLKEFGVNNAIYVPNFRNIQYRPDIKCRLDQLHKSTTFRFVYLSRIMKDKGVDVLMKAVDILNIQGFSKCFIVDFYGNIDNDYEADFMAKVGESENVDYKGFLDLRTSEGYNRLASYHCMIFPTYHKSEGFAGCLVDAYISGLPVIASDWKYNTEIVKDGETGITFPAKDEQALANIMQNVLNRQIDIDRLSINAQKESYYYDTSHIITEEFLRTIHIL